MADETLAILCANHTGISRIPGVLLITMGTCTVYIFRECILVIMGHLPM